MTYPFTQDRIGKHLDFDDTLSEYAPENYQPQNDLRPANGAEECDGMQDPEVISTQDLLKE